MKAKKEYILLAVVIAALGAYLVFHSADRTHYELPHLPAIEVAEVTRIEVLKGDTSIALIKQGNQWHFDPEGYPADAGKVKRMLEALEQLSVTALVSETKSYGRYDLDHDKKVTVKAWAGDSKVREFDMGKAASSFRHTFVKLAGDDRVYHGQGNFRGMFDQTADSFRDKTVLSFDQGEIQGIRITQDEEDITFVRTEVPVGGSTGPDETGQGEIESPPAETVWKTAAGKKGHESKLNSLLRTLSTLRCNQYMEGKTKEDFKDPIYSVQLHGIEEHVLSIYPKIDEEAEEYPAVSSMNDYPFLLSKWQSENLMKPGELLMETDESSEKEGGRR